MKQLDPKVTADLQNWLNSSDKDVMKGAELVLSVTRNRALYNSFLRRPDKFMAKVEYELRKHLNIRLHNMTVADVARLEKEVMPRVAETVANPPMVITTDDEFPEGHIATGKRADHDQLPPEIQDLWDSNGPRHAQITLLFNELKAMNDLMPCDRFEKLHLLDVTEAKYRANLAKYDAYQLGQPSVQVDKQVASNDEPVEAEPVDPELDKKVGAARKSLSKWRKSFKDAADDEARAKALAKIQEYVDVIKGLGAGLAEDTVAELSALGIQF